MSSTGSAHSSHGRPEPRGGDKAILFVLNALGIGGSERKTVSVVNELFRSGWNVHLAYLDDRTPLRGAVDSGIPVVYLNRQGKLSLKALSELRKYIREAAISEIVSVSLYPFLYSILASYSFPRRKRVPITVMINATGAIDRHSSKKMLLYRPLLQRAQRIVFGCKVQRDIWIKRYKLRESRCRVIYNGIDASKFCVDAVDIGADSELARILSRNNRVKIGAVGTLWKNKNHIELLRTLKVIHDDVPDALLVVAGEGPERKQLEKFAADNGLTDHVCLLGEIHDVRPLLAAIDVFVLPSISETFSNAALEAMAMKNVVILTNVDGSPEMVTDRVDGFLYEQGNIGSLGRLIKEIAFESVDKERIGEQARETVLARFTFQRMVDDYRVMLS